MRCDRTALFPMRTDMKNSAVNFVINLAIAVVLLLPACTSAPIRTPIQADVATWQQRAKGVTIIRDDWGVPHIYAKTDADVVFGLMYAQAEDDFNRIETNFMNAQGRLAEAEGEAAIFRDLRMKLFIYPEQLKLEYAKAEPWLQALMIAWADGLNFYLYTHPEVKLRVITKFEPWMALIALTYFAVDKFILATNREIARTVAVVPTSQPTTAADSERRQPVHGDQRAEHHPARGIDAAARLLLI
jgi:acyl-homoserine lactone acylase PvdQ